MLIRAVVGLLKKEQYYGIQLDDIGLYCCERFRRGGLGGGRDPTGYGRLGAMGGGLRSARWHYMNYAGKGEELYDMIKDPDQYANVVSDSKFAAILKKARAQFKDRMSAAK